MKTSNPGSINTQIIRRSHENAKQKEAQDRCAVYNNSKRLSFNPVFLKAVSLECIVYPRTNRKEETVMARLHIGHSFITHSFLLKGEEPPMCIGCDKR